VHNKNERQSPTGCAASFVECFSTFLRMENVVKVNVKFALEQAVKALEVVEV
jgi:hypothetical protein